MRFVFLAAVRWDSVLAGRTRRLAEAVLAEGHSAVFVELPGLRNTAARAVRRMKGAPAGNDGGVEVVRLGPVPGAARLPNASTTKLWQRGAVRRIRRFFGEGPTAVVVTTPWWAPVALRLAPDVLCYDCNDCVEVHCSPGVLPRFRRWHEELLGAADVVTVVSEYLRADVSGGTGASVHVIPNGVEQAWLEGAASPVPRSTLTDRPDRPIAGFVGSLFEWIDQDLLRACAIAMPDVEFILVGPTRREVSLATLKNLPNLRRVPAQPFEEVPNWIAAFDVCLVPFKRDAISAAADPVKFYEYCALGKPVVSTCGPGDAAQAPPLEMAESHEAFMEAIATALKGDSPERQRRRREAAAACTWRRRAVDLISAVEGGRGASE